MSRALAGIHHVTAIATDPQVNHDFYSGVLGLRLVKKTVNFDDPGTYHLYYGDGLGRPGTIMTFFPWPGARRGSRGTGQATATAFAVPLGSLEFWRSRLTAEGVVTDDSSRRFDQAVLTFLDPDGLKIELVETPTTEVEKSWSGSPVPAETSVRGFFGVTLDQRSVDPTRRFLEEVLGFSFVGSEGVRHRFRAEGSDGAGRILDILVPSDAGAGRIAAGTVHHVAWRVDDDVAETAWRERLIEAGFQVSPVMDRQYFHSIYFREPGGVLFEIATDPPGFTRDEDETELGTGLMLPPWLEDGRGQIEDALPTLSPTASLAVEERS